MSQTAKFKAFLSYSRKDEDVVRRLHRRLEQFEIPRALRNDGAARLGRFFRDKDELGAASALGEELRDKIAAAEWLIVCCSPASVASQWVDAEVDAFISTHGPNRILAVILDGQPHDVFPQSLRAREPLAADFRKIGDGEDLGFLKLVSGLLGVDLGELRDRQAAAERARVRNRAILAGVFGVLAIAASVSAVIAVQQRNRAEAMTIEAIDIGAGVVAQADSLSQRFGVPTSALEELLSFAEQRFDRLFEQNVQSTELARQRATVQVQFAELYQRTGDSERSRDQALAALASFERLPADQLRTIDYARALRAAGQAEAILGRPDQARTYLEGAVNASRTMLADIPDGILARFQLAASLSALGELHMQAQRPEDALPLFAEAAPLLEYVHTHAPEVGTMPLITALDWLGGAQSITGDRTAANTTFARSIAISRDWLERNPDSLAARSTLGSSLMKHAQTLADADDPAAARPLFEESLAIARTLAASDPNNAQYQRDVSLRLILTANVLTSLGQGSPAMVDEAINTLRAQVRADEANVELKETLAVMLGVRAANAQDSGNASAARNTWREVVALRRDIRTRAAAPTPTHAANIAFALEMIGDTSATLRDLPAMLEAYQAALPLRREALAAAPQDRAARASLAGVLHALGLTRKFNNDASGAIAALSEAARIRSALANSNRDDAAIAFLAVDSLQQLAVVQAGTDGAAARASFEQARTILRRLVAAHPDDARYADSLQRTEDVLQAWNAPTQETPAPETPAQTP